MQGTEFKLSDPHSQELVFVIKDVKLSDGYLALGNENVYSNHTFCQPIDYTAQLLLYKKYLFGVPDL